MGRDEMARIADLLVDAIHGDPTVVAPAVTDLRGRFTDLHFVRP